jgi:hypothetical protein
MKKSNPVAFLRKVKHMKVLILVFATVLFMSNFASASVGKILSINCIETEFERPESIQLTIVNPREQLIGSYCGSSGAGSRGCKELTRDTKVEYAYANYGVVGIGISELDSRYLAFKLYSYPGKEMTLLFPREILSTPASLKAFKAKYFQFGTMDITSPQNSLKCVSQISQ